MVSYVYTARQQIVRDAVPSSSCENYIGLDCTVVLLAVNAVCSFNNVWLRLVAVHPSVGQCQGVWACFPLCSLVVHVLHVMMLSGQVPADTMVTGQEALQRQLSH